MLSIQLICVGKLGEPFWKQACAEYEKRLSAYCKLSIVEIAEQKLPKQPSDAEIATALAKEAQQITDKIPTGAKVIALCIEGAMQSSVALAQTLSALQTQGVSKICFLIGGSFGLDATIKKQADGTLSMSPMTFPHHLARVMLLEQIYRACNVCAGGKYHK